MSSRLTRGAASAGQQQKEKQKGKNEAKPQSTVTKPALDSSKIIAKSSEVVSQPQGLSLQETPLTATAYKAPTTANKHDVNPKIAPATLVEGTTAKTGTTVGAITVAVNDSKANTSTATTTKKSKLTKARLANNHSTLNNRRVKGNKSVGARATLENNLPLRSAVHSIAADPFLPASPLRRPLTPFMIFAAEMRAQVAANGRHRSAAENGRELCKMWAQLEKEHRDVYVRKAREDSVFLHKLSLRSSSSSSSKKRKSRDPRAPRSAMTAYMFYSKAARSRIKDRNPAATFGELGRLIGHEWRALDHGAKAPFEELAKRDKERYTTAKALYAARRQRADALAKQRVAAALKQKSMLVATASSTPIANELDVVGQPSSNIVSASILPPKTPDQQVGGATKNQSGNANILKDIRKQHNKLTTSTELAHISNLPTASVIHPTALNAQAESKNSLVQPASKTKPPIPAIVGNNSLQSDDPTAQPPIKRKRNAVA